MWQTNGGTAELEIPLGKDAALWDEFHPALHRLTLRLSGDDADDTRELVFGLRDFVARGNRFVINAALLTCEEPITAEIFPPTGYPPDDVAYWKQLFQTCKDWGLNHVRFHSFCPPEAAFSAADEIGSTSSRSAACGMKSAPGRRWNG